MYQITKHLRFESHSKEFPSKNKVFVHYLLSITTLWVVKALKHVIAFTRMSFLWDLTQGYFLCTLLLLCMWTCVSSHCVMTDWSNIPTLALDHFLILLCKTTQDLLPKLSCGVGWLEIHEPRHKYSRRSKVWRVWCPYPATVAATTCWYSGCWQRSVRGQNRVWCLKPATKMLRFPAGKARLLAVAVGQDADFAVQEANCVCQADWRLIRGWW
jgi:hypothetical protein